MHGEIRKPILLHPRSAQYGRARKSKLSVEYRGTAHVDGTLVIRLTDCVGPMVPLAEFDDPQKLRTRFEELCRNGAVEGGFPGLPQLTLERTGGDDEHCVSASFRVPSEAPFFADHFPRRPVFPGSLLMHLNLQLGAVLASRDSTTRKGPLGAGNHPRYEAARLHSARYNPAARSEAEATLTRPGETGFRNTGSRRSHRDCRLDPQGGRWPMNPRRRVAITGIGMVTPVGCNAPTTWASLLAGRSGVGPIRQFDASGFPVRIGAEVKEVPSEATLCDPKLLKFASRSHRFALAAAGEALADAGIRPLAGNSHRWGLSCGRRHARRHLQRIPGRPCLLRAWTGNSTRTACSTPAIRPTRWHFVGARPTRVWDCWPASLALRVTPPRCTPPALPGARRWAPRSR